VRGANGSTRQARQRVAVLCFDPAALGTVSSVADLCPQEAVITVVLE
jgi:hypothetical protein